MEEENEETGKEVESRNGDEEKVTEKGSTEMIIKNENDEEVWFLFLFLLKYYFCYIFYLLCLNYIF
jgi:hypothetical protein